MPDYIDGLAALADEVIKPSPDADEVPAIRTIPPDTRIRLRTAAIISAANWAFSAATNEDPHSGMFVEKCNQLAGRGEITGEAATILVGNFATSCAAFVAAQQAENNNSEDAAWARKIWQKNKNRG